MKATKVGDIVRQLAAADKFLGNVRSLPSFQKIQQQQVDKFLGMMRNGKFNARSAQANHRKHSMEETMVER